MRVAILGYGGQGATAYEYWSEKGAEITIHDKDTTLHFDDNIKSVIGEDYLENLHQYDLLIRTPALHPSEITKANPDSPEILSKVTTVTNEFFAVCPSKKIIGVTGTKGKGTTSTLIAKMLESAGERVHLGGNIGIPPLELLKNDIKPQDYVVLELANFQVIDLRYSPHIAVCLMMVPEHLDWYDGDYQRYKDSKKPLFTHQTAEDIAISFADNKDSFEIASVSKGKKIPYYSPPGAWVKEEQEIIIDNVVVCKTDEIGLIGRHNWQNVCAAVTTVWQITHDLNAISQTIKSFKGLPFRIENRGTINQITYYNDSFATAPDSTVAALNAIDEPKVLIAGGFERGLDLTTFAAGIQSHSADLRKVVLIGESAERLAGKLREAGFENFEVTDDKSMDVIVSKATPYAAPGDAVVLSPGFASFDMFKNFEERGKAFNEAVSKL